MSCWLLPFPEMATELHYLSQSHKGLQSWLCSGIKGLSACCTGHINLISAHLPWHVLLEGEGITGSPCRESH